MENLPSVSIPESIPPCDVCQKGCTESISFQDLVQSTESGCCVCNLRYLAIPTICKKLAKPESNPHASFQFRGPVINIQKEWRVGRPEGDHIDFNSNVFLYTTRLSDPRSFRPFIGVGREVDYRASSYVPVLTRWLRACHENHRTCLPNIDVALPTRVLDVGDEDLEKIRLIEVVSGQRGCYTALSHCWGGGIETKTTTKNFVARKSGLHYSDLPLSFQHAVTVTRALGLSYLWVDALCIIQDSKGDWETESGNMAAIYQNAYLVLGADMSPNSLGGFLNVGEGGYNGAGWPIATIKNDKNIIYARSEHKGNNNYRGAHPLGSEPLSKRAWTLQEQILASKMVHFASKEMVWECKSTLSCECMQVDREVFPKNPPLSLRSPMNHSFPAKFKLWYALVNEVTVRSITKPEDILPCLSGMAQHFQHSGAGVYLAGLWQEDLPLGLLWSRYSNPGTSRAVPYRGPSWSWTSIDQIEYPYSSALFTDNDNELKKVYARIIKAKCFPDGKNPLGTVSGGYLKVAAPLLRLEEKLGITPWYDFEENTPRKELFCLFVGEVTGRADGEPFRGLILQERRDCFSWASLVDSDHQKREKNLTFERVGWFSLSSGEEIPMIKGVKDSTVTII